MIKVTREEVLKIAQMAYLEIHEDEINPIIERLESVLNYAAVRVSEVAADVQISSNKNSNVFREDIVVPSNPEPLLKQAPEREEQYFVVPTILEN